MALAPSPASEGLISDSTSLGSRVHFDNTCVLIPDLAVQSRMPRLIKKSYSLPLWRKRSGSIPPVDGADAAPGPGSPTEERNMVIKVSVPSFSKSRSLTRGESLHQPLVPCIVNADGAHSRCRSHVRRPSLPLPSRPDAVTVPLRPCCRECYPITEECLKEGIEWEEKFTRAARRRRNSSADLQAHAHAQRHRRVQDDVPGFGAIVSVDEVDKRHGTSSDSAAPVITSTEFSDNEEDAEHGLLPSLSRRLQLSEPVSKSSSAIVEEDEAELSDTGFPLPSPRRTPSGSPSASSSHLPQDARNDNVPFLSQAMNDGSALERMLAVPNSDGDDEGGIRASVYYTPDTSPAIPALEPSSIVSSPGGVCDSPTPITPPMPHLHSTAQPIPIPHADAAASAHHRNFNDLKIFAGLSSPTFDVLHSPPSSSVLPKECRGRYSDSTGSPDLSDLPVLPSPGSPRKRPGLHIPHLPGPGSFFKAGAEMLKGVGSLGSGSGPLPMSV